MPRVLVVQHDPDDHLNELAGPLVAAGLTLEPWCVSAEPTPQRPAAAYDAIISMGAGASAADPDPHPWQAVEAGYLADALARQRPILGICFGSQILARVAGGQVSRAPEHEIGWGTVERDPAGADDLLLGLFGDRFPAFQFHYDTFTLPDSATVLARGNGLLQAYRIGSMAWGLQFHIEAGPGVVLAWLGSSRLEMAAAGVDTDAMLADTARHWHWYRSRCWELGAAFAQVVLDASPGTGRHLRRGFIGSREVPELTTSVAYTARRGVGSGDGDYYGVPSEETPL